MEAHGPIMDESNVKIPCLSGPVDFCLFSSGAGGDWGGITLINRYRVIYGEAGRNRAC